MQHAGAVERPHRGLAGDLARPSLIVAVLAAACMQVALVAADLGGLPCPLLQATGLPCPGCGMSRALVALVQGDWAEMLRLHALAPLALLGAVALAVVAVLPRNARDRAFASLASLESRRAIPLAALALLVGHWLVRLALGWRG